jgi:hypothetical protein
MKKSISKIKSQALLDFILVFGILVALMAGLIRIWVWFDANFAKRNVDYQNTRLQAGQAAHGGDINYTDETLAIDDNWVFKGESSGSVGTAPEMPFTVISALSGDGNSGSTLVCESAKNAAAALRTEAENMIGQAENIRDFTDWGDDWYDPLYWLFQLMNIDIDGMVEAAESLEENAELVKTKAAEIESAGCPTS